MKMKKWNIAFFFLLFSLLMISCSEDDNNNPPGETPPPEETEPPIEIITELTYQARLYGLDKEGLNPESLASCEDTAFIAFSGRTDENKLWIATFEKSTKKKIVQWTEDSPLPTEITIDLGYGESRKYDINQYGLRTYPVYNQKNMTFILTGISSSGGVAVSHLYFLKDNRLQKKITSSGFMGDGSDTLFERIYGWHNNSVMVKTHTKYTCYSETGAEIFSFTNDGYLFDDKLDPVNYYEAIDFRSAVGNHSAKRVDLNNNKIIWESRTSAISDLPSNVRVDNVTLTNKQGDMWTYLIDYTLYDGTKGKKEIKMDINTGDYS